MFFNQNVKFPWTIVVLMLLIGGGTASAQEEKISLRDRTISAGSAMRVVENQTGYRFSYNRNLYDTTRVITLPASTLALKEILDHMVSGADVRYMIHGRYIAFVPSNDNSRPQVRRAEPARTSDVYVRNHPNSLTVMPIQRPVVETPTVAAETEPVPVPAPEPAPEPAKELYSDYRAIDLYGDLQQSLPRFAIRVNLLYGLSTLTPNIAADVALSRRSTLGVSYSSNPWRHKADLDDNRKLLHGIVSLGYRYWLCERYNGHFFGAQAFYSEYNISGTRIPILFDKAYRYKGNAFGGGVQYGYAQPLGNRWNLEFTAGLHVLHMDYDRYTCRTCDTASQPFTKTHLAPSAGIHIVFLIR